MKDINRRYEVPFSENRMSLYNFIYFYFATSYTHRNLSDDKVMAYTKKILKDIEEEFK